MKYSELEKQLRKIGCYPIEEGGNHRKWFSPITGKKFPVSRHKTEDVPTGTLRSIKKDSGLQ